MIHSPAFVIIFRRLRHFSKIVNTGSENPGIDENCFHGGLRYWLTSRNAGACSATRPIAEEGAEALDWAPLQSLI